MESTRRTAALAGVCYLITHVASIAALVLYGPVLNNRNYVTGPGADTRILVGGLLEVIVALAIVGTGVTLYPVVRQHSPAGALGYAALRTMEAATILVGVVTLLGVVTLRQQFAGQPDRSLTTAGQALVAVHNWTFLIGPGLVLGTNTVVLAYALYRSGLVARFIPVLGLIGGPLVLASDLAVMFGVYPQISAIAGLGAVLVFAWEICLAVHLIVKGFRGTVTGGSAPRVAVGSA